MRRKIAKRRRRDILTLGGVFEKEEWYGPKALSRKENSYAAHLRYEGYRILAIGEDELDAYQLALWCMRCTRKMNLNSKEKTHDRNTKYNRNRDR